MIYRTKLPRYGQQPSASECNCCFFASILLSVLAHLLLFLLFVNHQEKPSLAKAGKPGKGPQTMEVTLSTAPKAKPSPAQKPLAAPPPAPKPAPEPKPKPLPKAVAPEKPVVKQPRPKPLEPKRPKLPIPAIEPEPPKPRKPVVTPKSEPDALPEFKDDFAELSQDYAHSPAGPQGAESAGGAPGQSDNGVHPGSIVNINPRIHYPVQAMRQGMQGVVVVLIHIAPDGTTNGVDLLHSSGYDALDNEVLGAVQHWRFKPPMRGNTPVEGVYKHRVIFGADENVIDDFETHWREIELQPAGE